MPVCKCRKATKLYCFVHRTPVCLDCICAKEHEHCVVSQYSDWVNDGDYDWPPRCAVCDESLEDSDKATLRLGCLHVPHAKCLQKHLESFPAHTAPAGYTCPSSGCQTAVWPPKSQKDAASTLFTNLRGLIAETAVGEGLLKASITPAGFTTPPLQSREASADDLRALGSSGAGGALDKADDPSKAIPNGTKTMEIIEEHQPAVETALKDVASPAKPSVVQSPVPGPRSRAGTYGTVAVDIQEEPRLDYPTDDEGGEKNVTHVKGVRISGVGLLLPMRCAGPPQVQLLRFLGSLWAPPGLHTHLPVTHSKKEKDDAGEAADYRIRRARSTRGGAMDPRKLLLFLAIASCVATMLLLYYRLAQGGFSTGMLLP